MKEQDLAFFIDDLGLRHFKGAEIAAYGRRERDGVRNSVPAQSLWPNIIHTLVVADEIRERLGSPLTVTSAYRSPAYNAAVGGERGSYHMRFMALDLAPAVAKVSAVAALARALRGKKFKVPGTNDTFIWRGGIGVYPAFAHIDTRGYDANWKG